MKTAAISAFSIDELKQKISALDFTPTLAFVFSDIKFSISQIQNVFTDIDLFGATSAGEIINDKFNLGSISALLLDLPRDKYRIFFEKNAAYRQWTASGLSLGSFAKKNFSNPAIVLSAPGFAGGDFIIKGINFQLPDNTTIIGGFAGDDLSFSKAKVYTNLHSTDDGVVAVIFDADKVLVDGLAVNGWPTFGTQYVITEAKENIVYKINDKPALEVFKQVYNIPDSEIENLVNNFGPKYPALVTRYSRPPVLRHPIKADINTGALIFSAFIPNMSEIDFGLPATEDILITTAEKLKAVKDKHPDIDALIMFSCKARHLAFGTNIIKEISTVYSYWSVPTAGLFTYGEIGISSDGKTDFHNETFNVLVLKEK